MLHGTILAQHITPFTRQKKEWLGKDNSGKGKNLSHQGNDKFGRINCDYFADAFWVLGKRPDVVLF